MSTARDLYWQAVGKVTPPVTRLYFDTEALRYGNWPFTSKQFAFVLEVAHAMGVELFIPEPALYERAEQWMKEARSRLDTARAKVKDALGFVQPLGAAIPFEAPGEAALRTSYASASQRALNRFKVKSAPYGSRPIAEVFQWAVQRAFTFQDTQRGVVGLQDCVILLSVLDHLRTSPATAAFVSSDGVFDRIPKLTPAGVSLRHIPGLLKLQEVLEEAHDPVFTAEIEKWWEEEGRRIEQVLTNEQNQVLSFLEQTVDPGEIERLFGGSVISSVISVGLPRIQRFSQIRPDPKNAASDPLSFSCDVNVSYTATVELRLGIWSAFLPTSPPGGSLPGEPASRQVVENRSVTIELGASVALDYTHLTLQTARIRA